MPRGAHVGSAPIGIERDAIDLVEYLLESDGTKSERVCEQFGWTRGHLTTVLAYARNVVGPELAITIPHPVPTDGWLYRATSEWTGRDGSAAIGAGANFAMAQIEGRMRSVQRDVAVAVAHLDPQSLDGRKANLLNKHLLRMFGTLSEITESEHRKRGVA